jgi:hypothetical protein
MFIFTYVLMASCLLTMSASAAQPQRRRPAGRAATIRGELSYPSEGIPPEMVVCAESLKTGNVICKGTDDRDRQYDLRYELKVPPGSYFIYATLPADSADGEALPPSQQMYRAYYSEYVKCVKADPSRNPDECRSHAPVRVTARAGQVVSGIDPGDWYNH